MDSLRMTERPSSSKNSQHKPSKPETPNQKYNKAEILNICNKTDKKCFEDMVKRFEDKKNQSSIKSISAASSSISNKSTCSTRHSFHTIQSPSAKKPMRNCKSLNFENSKQFSPIYNSDGGSTSSGRAHHTKTIESKMKKNTNHLNVFKTTELADKTDGSQSNCTNNGNNEDDDGILNFDDGNYIQVNMTTIGGCNAFEMNNANLCYHDKLKSNSLQHDNLEKGVREETRITGVKILLRGDILGAINCLLPQLNLVRSVNLKHCKDVIVKAREYRKQIFEINKTKNLHVIQEHEYNIEKQEVLKTLEDSICDVIDAKEIANAEKILENYKIPSQTFNQSSIVAGTDNGKRNKSTCKCKTQTKHSSQRGEHDGKKPQSAPSNLVEENVKNNNLKLQQKCKKSNLANSHRDKRKQQAKKIIFTTFFKNSNLDRGTDEKSVKNVWENSSAKFTKFTDSESSSVVTISEDEVHTDVCTSSAAKSIHDDAVKVVDEPLSEKKTDYELVKKLMQHLQEWYDEKRRSNVCASSKPSAINKQLDLGKRTYSSVLKCSSSEKKTEKRKNSVKAKNKLTALSVNQKKENAKENRNYVSSAAAVASAPAVLENSNETQTSEKTSQFCAQSSSSTTSINHEPNTTTPPVLDENTNNTTNVTYIAIQPLLSDEDILLQLEKRIVYDLETILNECNEDDERFLCTNGDDSNTISSPTTGTTTTTQPITNLKQYNQLIDQLNYTRLVQNMILPQFAAGYNAIANQYNYFWPMNNIMYSRNVIANYPQLFQHSIVINPIGGGSTAGTTDTTKLEATLNELNSLKRNCQNNQQTGTELRDVIMYQNKNFDSHSNFNGNSNNNNIADDNINLSSGASKMISVSDLEKEALEQYKHSDVSLNKKFDVLEKEAEEQYDGYE